MSAPRSKPLPKSVNAPHLFTNSLCEAAKWAFRRTIFFGSFDLVFCRQKAVNGQTLKHGQSVLVACQININPCCALEPVFLDNVAAGPRPRSARPSHIQALVL